MRGLFFVALVFVASSALANVRVGEFKAYSSTKNGVTNLIKQTFTSFNAEKNLLTVSTTVRLPDNREVEVATNTLSGDDAWTHQKAQQVLESCEDLQGQLDSINVGGRSHSSCHFQIQDPDTNENIDLWMADVPLDGVVRIEGPETGTLELLSYKWND